MQGHGATIASLEAYKLFWPWESHLTLTSLHWEAMREENLLCLPHQHAWKVWKNMALLQFTGPLFPNVSSNKQSFHCKAGITADIKQLKPSVSSSTCRVFSQLSNSTGIQGQQHDQVLFRGWEWTPKLRVPSLFSYDWVCQQHSTRQWHEARIWKVYSHDSNLIFLLIDFIEICVFIYLLWSTCIRNDSSVLLLLLIENIQNTLMFRFL